VEVTTKRLELLHELVPKAVPVAVLFNSGKTTPRDVQEAARAIGLQVRALNAITSREIDAVFATVERERLDALFVAGGPFLGSPGVQIVSLVARDRIPAVYGLREYVVAGGLMSYGTNFADQFHQVGVYTSSILKGANPAELPVLHPTKFESSST
jgi:putative tryptophan/tyrosine transport system substrate-binding protein